MSTYTITCDCCDKTRELPDIAQYRDLTTGDSKKARTARHNLVNIAGLRARLAGN